MTLASIALAALVGTGCLTPVASLEIPPAGQPMPHAHVLEEGDSGPIVALFPGRSAPVDDPNLGILQMARKIADRIDGSIGLFNVNSYAAASGWVMRQAELRRARGEPGRLALVGHSWGGWASAKLLEELLAADAIDEVSLLVTIDAIEEGYLRTFFYHLFPVITLESVFPHRLKLLALSEMPVPNGATFLKHVNYYQLDSPHLSGDAVPTASQNHEVWFDEGTELGHGNLDNYLSDIVAEEVVRTLGRPRP